MGFPIIATLLLLFSLPLMFFPERLPKTDTDANKEAKENLLEGKTPLKDDFIELKEDATALQGHELTGLTSSVVVKGIGIVRWLLYTDNGDIRYIE